MSFGPSHRRRFLAGLAAALARGVGGSWLLLRGAHGAVAEEVRLRKATVAALALAELVGRAGESGAAVRSVDAAWQSHQPPGDEARVVIFQGLSLEASTSARDTGDRAAPRRLSRDEKELFDRGQRLRAAVAGNRDGGASKPEIELERAAGGLQAAVPLARDGQVVGLVQLLASPPAALPEIGLLAPIAAALLPLLAFLALARLVGERRWPLAAAATACAIVAVAAFGLFAAGTLERARRQAHADVAAFARAQATQSLGLATQLSLATAPPFEPSAWAADVFSRPRGSWGCCRSPRSGSAASPASAAPWSSTARPTPTSPPPCSARCCWSSSPSSTASPSASPTRTSTTRARRSRSSGSA